MKVMPKVLVLVAAAAIAAGANPSTAAAQNCRRGIPCGNSCIAATRVCHIGGGTARSIVPRNDTTSAAEPEKLVSPPRGSGQQQWVGSFADGVYFLASCTAAQDLAPANRRTFTSESAAIAAGYRHSRTPGC